MQNQNSVITAATLANAADLAANIALGILGNEVAATFNGSTMTRAAIYELSLVTFQGKISTYLGDR